MSNKDQSSSELIRATETGAYARWQMPSFDQDALNVIPAGDTSTDKAGSESVAEAEPEVEVEEVELETVQPLTLEEVEAVRQDAYNEGFSTGEKDGFRAGQLRAQQEAEAALKPRLQAL